MKTVMSKVYIKETEDDRKYQGNIIVEGIKLNFEFDLLVPSEEFERTYKTKSRNEADDFVRKNTYFELTKENGDKTGLTISEKEILLTPVLYAYGYLMDSRIKGQGTERTFEIPLIFEE